MLDSAVDDVGVAHSGLDGLERGGHLGDHPRVEARQQLSQLLGGDLRDEAVRVRPVAVEARDVRQHHELVRAHVAGDRRGRQVRVHVERSARLTASLRRDRAHDGHAAGVQELVEQVRRHGLDGSHAPQVDALAVDECGGGPGQEQVAVLARQAHRGAAVLVDARDDVAVDVASEHHPRDVRGLLARDALARAELALDAQAVEHGGDLGAAAVDDDGADAGEPQERDVIREGLLELRAHHRVAAVLDDDGRAREGLDPGQRLREDVRLRLRLCQALRGCRGLVCCAHVEYALFSST